MLERSTGARSSTKAYGAVSVKVAYWATAEVVGRVPPSVFLPRPKVESALVGIRRRPKPAGLASVPPDELFRLVRAGFGQRRKTLRRSLASVASVDDLVAAGIDPGARAEQLDVAAWVRLASVGHDRRGTST
jgi:16S rRNA (adenine1518-N6/adenine1519-N6)-dimethyltransferase